MYLTYMIKGDFALNNLQWLIYHKTKPGSSIIRNSSCTATYPLSNKTTVGEVKTNSEAIFSYGRTSVGRF